MKKYSFLLTLVISLNVWSQLPGSTTKPTLKADPKATQFGAELTLKDAPLSVDEALEKFKAKQITGPVLLTAKIDKVCKKKGCWMTIKSKSDDLRVTFKDYGFFVPQNIVGKNVLVEGVIKEEKLTLEETKHFVKDEGGDPSKVTEAKTDYQFVANGVKLVSK
jgi:hypothetical protein